MNPRVSRSSRARLQGHRLPHRQDRRQAGHRLHAGRAAQRHHPRHPRLLRAHHRLRGGEDPALDLREVPRRRPHPHHQMNLGGRSDGHRPHLQGGLPEGPALHGDRAARSRAARSCPREGASASKVLGRGPERPPPRPAPGTWLAGLPRGLVAWRRGARALRQSIPFSCARSRNRGARRRRSRIRPARADAGRTPARGQAHGFTDQYLSPAAGHGGGRGPPAAPGPGHPARLQEGGHLRRRVRGLHPLLLLHL